MVEARVEDAPKANTNRFDLAGEINLVWATVWGRFGPMACRP